MPASTVSSALVQRVWNYAHVLKDDGMAFMDYTEQITYLLFLKMMWERRGEMNAPIPARYTWGALTKLTENRQLLDRYHQGLRRLSELPGLIGLIYAKPQSKINDPAKLRRLMELINAENWSSLDVDVKGDVYEGLLARNADDVRGGAGQYFTPRPVIRAIVEVVKPTPFTTIADPACGTGGFLLAAFEYLRRKVANEKEIQHLRNSALHGTDLVPNVARLCAMNLFLHGIGVQSKEPLVAIGDSLEMASKPVDLVLTNPPFGKKSSFTIVGADGRKQKEKLSYVRPDFWATTSNKQLNFVQHVYSMLKNDGRAAVVIPDNVLFEGGAGEKIRRELLRRCDVHTLLRLPTGIWYSAGVKANVIFFDKERQSDAPATGAVWVYDLRSDQKFSLRHNQIKEEDLRDFVACYKAGNRETRKETTRFRRFSYESIISSDKASLDISWASRNSTEGESPDAIFAAIVSDLEEALAQFAAASSALKRN